jgi:hypothetical protein
MADLLRLGQWVQDLSCQLSRCEARCHARQRPSVAGPMRNLCTGKELSGRTFLWYSLCVETTVLSACGAQSGARVPVGGKLSEPG